MLTIPSQITEKTHELLVKIILDQILSADGVNNIKVNHNIFLRGKDVTHHQIDIYWEFQIEDVKYSSVIEVKDSGTPIKLESLFLFRSVFDDVLGDLPGKPIGILVSNTGYTENARAYASERGILLYELREHSGETDQEDRIKKFDINIDIYIPIFSNIKLIQDAEWNVQHLKHQDIPLSEASKIRVEVSDDSKFYDEKGVESITALKLFNSLVPEGFNELPPTKITYVFDKPTFINTSNPNVRMKLTSIEVTISKILTAKKFMLEGEDFVQFVMRSVENGTTKASSRGD